MNENKIWNLPALEFCTITRAAKLLGCEISDLLHWAEIGAIELCLKFNRYEVALYASELLGKTPSESTEWLNKKFTDGVLDAFNVSYFSYPFLSGISFPFEVIQEDSGEHNRKFYFDGDIPVLSNPIGCISGLWALLSMSDENLFSKLQSEGVYHFTRINVLFTQADQINYEGDLISASPCKSPAYKNDILIEPQEIIFSITPEDLFITKKQLSKLTGSEEQSVASYVSGTVKTPTELTEKPRVTKKQSDYILALLRGYGLTDDDFQGSIMELKNKISNRTQSEIPDVDDKTLIDWLLKAGVHR